MTQNEIIGMVLSIIGMLITALSFQAKKKTVLLIYQTVGSSFYLASYIFSGAGIAAILNVIFLVRNLMNIYVDKKGRKAKLILCICLCISYVAAYAVYIPLVHHSLKQNLLDLLPVAGSIFGTIAFMNTDIIKLRLWKIGDAACWLCCNASIGLACLGGIIGEIMNLTSLGISLLRFGRKKNREAAEAVKQEETIEKQ